MSVQNRFNVVASLLISIAVVAPAAAQSYQSNCDRHCQAEFLSVVEQAKLARPDLWMRGPASSRDLGFVTYLVTKLRDASFMVGLNGKRGTDTISHDAVALANVRGCPDTSGRFPGLSIIDFVGDSETPRARPTFHDASADPAGVCLTSGKFIDPDGAPPSPAPQPAVDPIARALQQIDEMHGWLKEIVTFVRALQGQQ